MANTLRKLGFESYLDEQGIKEESYASGLTNGELVKKCYFLALRKGSKFWACVCDNMIYVVGDNGIKIEVVSRLHKSILASGTWKEVKLVDNIVQIKPNLTEEGILFFNSTITGATQSFVDKIVRG